MIKTTAVVFLSGFLLLEGNSLSSPPIPAPRQVSFCPECWKFLDETWDLDLQGQCMVSRKEPIKLEGVTATWLWCRTHDAWHPRPCGKNYLVASEATALLLPSGSERVTSHAYCPQDRLFSDLGHEGLRCPKCSKPMVMADTVERTWFWCSSEKAWLTKRCSFQRSLRCCSPRTGVVLACPWQVPPPGEISDREPAGTDLRVEAVWLAAHLDDPHLVVIHVGFDPSEPGVSLERSTYLEGHVQGARSIAWNELVVTRKGIPNELPKVEQLVQLVRSLGIDRSDRIVLYDTGYGVEAARAYLTLDYLGLGERAAILDGQWARWKALKYPVSCMTEEAEPSAFVPELRPDILVSLSEMKDLAWMARQQGGKVALLDARSAEEFSGYQAGKGILRPGHISGAANLCWSQLLDSSELPLLRPENELRGAFESVGVRPGRTVVTYCRTGTEACLLYFAAKTLGYETRFYDGSYYEWSREDEGPIEGSWARADRR